MTNLRLVFMSLALLVLLLRAPLAAESTAIVDVRLIDGSVLKGVVTSRSPQDITLRTTDGTLRIAASRMTQASRDALLGPEDPAACQARVRDLESQVRALELENQDLRKRLAERVAVAPQSLSAPRGDASRSSAAGQSYTISSTGKRHNSRCRYYGTGRAGGSTEGIACKVCGG